MQYTLDEIVRACGAEYSDKKKAGITGISTDTRTIGRREAFIALRGDKYDGHDYISRAVAAGASCLIVEKSVFKEKRLSAQCKKVPVIFVNDTLKALGDIARYHRSRCPAKTIAITGSSGKTTVKELVGYLLGSKYSVLKTEGTFNNLIGLPKTIFGLSKRHQICVLEMGTNTFGEIKRLSEIAGADCGIITNIGPSHLEGLKTESNVFKEKFELVRSLAPQGWAVLNADDRYLRKARVDCRVKYFSIDGNSDLRASSITFFKDRVTFKANGYTFTVHMIGKHSVYNALAAICAGEIYGLSMKDIRDRISDYRSSLKNRLSMETQSNIFVLNDCYNANPLSFCSSINALAGLRFGKRKIVVASDMLELGSRAVKCHRDVGKVVARTGVDYLFTVGDLSRFMGLEAVKTGMKDGRVMHFATKQDLIVSLTAVIRKGDIVLVKGSRRTGMEDVVSGLREDVTRGSE